MPEHHRRGPKEGGVMREGRPRGRGGVVAKPITASVQASVQSPYFPTVNRSLSHGRGGDFCRFARVSSGLLDTLLDTIWC